MITRKSFKYRLNQCCRKYKSIYDESIIYLPQTQRHSLVRASAHLGITPLTGKFVKMPKKSAIFDHMLLDGHKASFDNFSILLKETNAFKLQLKESLLISRDKPILNKSIYSFPLERFD